MTCFHGRRKRQLWWRITSCMIQTHRHGMCVVQGRLNKKIWSKRASYFYFRHAIFHRMVDFQFFHIMSRIAMETWNLTYTFVILSTDCFLNLLEGYRVCKFLFWQVKKKLAPTHYMLPKSRGDHGYQEICLFLRSIQSW